MGQKGYCLLVNRDNEIISSPEDMLDGEKLDPNLDLWELAESGKIAKDTIYGVSSYIGTLSDGINYMVDRLKGLIKEAEERIDAELALAAKIQTSFLPREFPPFPDRDKFELYACMIPAKEVGGDFYDFFLIDDDHLAIVIADVSGIILSAIPGHIWILAETGGALGLQKRNAAF